MHNILPSDEDLLFIANATVSAHDTTRWRCRSDIKKQKIAVCPLGLKPLQEGKIYVGRDRVERPLAERYGVGRCSWILADNI